MNRWSIRIVICLVLGMALTVAVAWIVAWFDVHLGEDEITSHSLGEDGDVPDTCELMILRNATTRNWNLIAHSSRGFHLPDGAHPTLEPATLDALSELGLPRAARDRFEQVYAEITPREYGSVFTRAAGWPQPALAFFEVTTATANGKSEAAEFTWTQPDMSSHEHALPWLPIWPGLLLNILIYACVTFVLWMSTVGMCSRWRRWRGRCVRCGYQLRDQTRCPECGTRQKGSTAGHEHSNDDDS